MLASDGCNTAPVSALILVVVWLISSTAMFLLAASLPILLMKSPITAQRLLAAHWTASLFGAVGIFLTSDAPRALGKARANRMEMASMTMRLVLGGGKDGEG